MKIKALGVELDGLDEILFVPPAALLVIAVACIPHAALAYGIYRLIRFVMGGH